MMMISSAVHCLLSRSQHVSVNHLIIVKCVQQRSSFINSTISSITPFTPLTTQVAEQINDQKDGRDEVHLRQAFDFSPTF